MTNFGSIANMIQLLLVSLISFTYVSSYHAATPDNPLDVTDKSLPLQNPLTSFVEIEPLINIISSGVLPHTSSVHYLRAEILKDDFKIPIHFEWETGIAISDTVLLQPNLKSFRSVVLAYFQQNQKSDSEMDLEWVRAPDYDFHSNEFHFSSRLINADGTKKFYGKSIYLLQNGYFAFQILAPFHEKLSAYINQWARELKIKQDVDYTKSSNPRVRDMRALLQRWALPFGAVLQTQPEDTTSSNVQSETRRTIGITFLIFSILFFILITPRNKQP